MTPDLLERLLTFWQSELIALRDAVSREMNADLGKDIALDHPSVAWRVQVRDHLDQSVHHVALALLHARAPEIAARLLSAQQEQP